MAISKYCDKPSVLLNFDDKVELIILNDKNAYAEAF
jgi:hypothetical protein